MRFCKTLYHVTKRMFTDIRELSMDILRQGRHVEVLGPKELKDEVMSELKAALGQY